MDFSYQEKNTCIHQLHTQIKCLWVFGVFLGSILLNDPILLLILFLSTIPYVVAAHVTHEWIAFMKLAVWFSVCIIAINVLVNTYGATTLFSLKGIPLIGMIHITSESLVFSLSVSLRLLCTLSVFSLFTLTINPDQLLSLFLRLHIPKKTVFTTAVSLRFIPVLFQDLHTLKESLQTRGYTFQNTGFIHRIQQKMILFHPLLSSALDRAIQSAEAMEARGYASSTYISSYHSTSVSVMERSLLFLTSGISVFFILIWLSNYVSYEYYPLLQPIIFSPQYLSILFGMIIVVLIPVVFSPLQQVIDLD